MATPADAQQRARKTYDAASDSFDESKVKELNSVGVEMDGLRQVRRTLFLPPRSSLSPKPR